MGKEGHPREPHPKDVRIVTNAATIATLVTTWNNAFKHSGVGKLFSQAPIVAFAFLFVYLPASPALLKQHCAECHNAEKAKGKFKLSDLGTQPSAASLERWLEALDLVSAGEMPPEEDAEISPPERKELVAYLKGQLGKYEQSSQTANLPKARRLNNREFANSIRDVLLIEDIGTHLPTANLIGDSLHQGFETHAETLGFSKFHLEQYIEAVRKIVDATILEGDRPTTRKHEFTSTDILSANTSQNTTRRERRGKPAGFDFLDPRRLAYFEGFSTVQHTGRYKITVTAAGLDRTVYPAKETGVYHGDPIRLEAIMGDRRKTFELPDNELVEIELDEWLAEGTRFRLRHPTDGLKMRANGNFKFQNAITGEYLKKHDPDRWQKVADAFVNRKAKGRKRNPESWHAWVDHWMGPRPRLHAAVVEGPYFVSWPPARQVALLGKAPKLEDTEKVLRPIAERAWRRPLREGELDPVVKLVQAKAGELGTVGALKEGLVSILVSSPFLLLNTEGLTPAERFASKFSYFLESTLPDEALGQAVQDGKLREFEGVFSEIQKRMEAGKLDPFLRAFPFAWLKLNDINFMAPDPDQYRFYHRKDVSADMVDEALHFFRHAVSENLPLTEFLSADYSFVNADLAQVYGLADVPQDSTFRKYTFQDGRRGGLLGMSAFLTVTADSLGTSPIHRAIYVMENYLGIHPTPPPPDVEILEPDVRQAKTIKEVLEAHRSDPNCASCHRGIDPYGYAFENFDPTGAWRDVYVAPEPVDPDSAGQRVRKGMKKVEIPIDASAEFRNGNQYKDIVGFRELMLTEANRNRFVRCFITKLLTYANGEEPDKADFAGVEAILEKSAENGYRIVDTIAAVVDSPLFRGRQ